MVLKKTLILPSENSDGSKTNSSELARLIFNMAALQYRYMMQ